MSFVCPGVSGFCRLPYFQAMFFLWFHSHHSHTLPPTLILTDWLTDSNKWRTLQGQTNPPRPILLHPHRANNLNLSQLYSFSWRLLCSLFPWEEKFRNFFFFLFTFIHIVNLSFCCQNFFNFSWLEKLQILTRFSNWSGS